MGVFNGLRGTEKMRSVSFTDATNSRADEGAAIGGDGVSAEEEQQ